MKVMLLGLMAGAALWAGEPTTEEKLSVSALVRRYYQLQTQRTDLEKQINTVAQQANERKAALEKKYNCAYDFNTDTCTSLPKAEKVEKK